MKAGYLTEYASFLPGAANRGVTECFNAVPTLVSSRVCARGRNDLWPLDSMMLVKAEEGAHPVDLAPRSRRMDKPGAGGFVQLMTQPHQLLGKWDEELKIDIGLIARGRRTARRLPGLPLSDTKERLHNV